MRAFVPALCLIAVAIPPALSAEPAAQPAIRVLLTYGGHGCEEKKFYAMFDALPGITYTKAKLPDDAGRLKPGLEKDFDVIVRYDMVHKLPPDEEKAFVALLDRGIGLVAMHHNLGAHDDWPGYAKIIGGRYCHTKLESGGKTYGPSAFEHGQTMKIAIADHDHPITRGLADFTINDETYGNCFISPGDHVLLTTDNSKNNRQVAWTLQYKRSRVFYFQLGHDSNAWKHTAYPQILERGIRWAAEK